jgi:hypothetical protein
MSTHAGAKLTYMFLVIAACDGKTTADATDAAYDTKSDKGPPSKAAFDTGLDGARTLSALTDAEKNTACANAISYFSLSISRAEACRLIGVMNAAGDAKANSYDDATIQLDCSTHTGACPDETPTSRDYYIPMCVDKLDCPGTVSEYETCVNDLRAALQHGMVGLPSCNELTAANVGSLVDPSVSLESTNQPASCAALATKCTGLTHTVVTGIYPAGY